MPGQPVIREHAKTVRQYPGPVATEPRLPGRGVGKNGAANRVRRPVGKVATESETKWGRLRRERHRVQRLVEAGLPAVEVARELVVEDAGADLQQEVGSAAGCPAHLLF